MSVGYLSSVSGIKRTRLVRALLCPIVLLAAVHAWAAAAPPSAAPSSAAAAGADGTYTYRIPLLRQYPEQGLTLLGQDAYAGMDFGLRRDERVVGARLELDYQYSPALIPGLSHLNVLLNSVVGATLALPQQPASRPAARHVSVPLPVGLLTEFNHLNLELIAHSKGSDQGDNPQSPDLWLKAAPTSSLVVTVAPIVFPSDLSQLPAPFVDTSDVRRVELPIVMPRAPNVSRLESAGIVTSWLGARAGYRGAHFTASLGAIPARGHAIVLVLQGELSGALPGMTLPIDGPTLSIVPNPNDPRGKLLVIAGRSEAELRQAATALALGARTLAGSTVTIDAPVKVFARKPYDAPNWLPSDRPVPLGELAPTNQFTVAGFGPEIINVGLKLPPGLFGFDNGGAVLNLHYRYTARPESLHSEMRVLIGNTPIGAVPLPGDQSEGRTTMRVPSYLLPPLTTLQFDYRYDTVMPKDHWQVVAGGPLRSGIDPSSTIDISNVPRYAAMPDLRAFGDAGFPFTRMADLSDTAVMLPLHPSADDYSAYLTLMGSMGQASGYPVLGMTLGDPEKVDEVRNKDLLVLASGDNQPLLNAWHDRLPRGFFGPVPASGAVPDWWDRLTDKQGHARRAADAAAFYGGDRNGMVAGFESPLASGRSVVVVSGHSPQGLDSTVNVLQAHRYLIGDGGNRSNETVGGSLVAVHDGVLTTLEDDQHYFIGSLPLHIAIEWYFASHILLLLVVTLISVVLIGLLGGIYLHGRALNRLDLASAQPSQREEGRRGSHVQ